MPKPKWLEMKLTLGFDFPNLPYYQVRTAKAMSKCIFYLQQNYKEGNLKLTQSGAILRHLARKFKLDGTNEKV